ncbi:MAG: DNA alkylation repair protein [Sandaracinaceae bacterium]|nr:DNA alkylation repair protein [Sandaracinaceae bacterium]
MQASQAIEAGLRAIGDPERAVQGKAYLKSEMVHLGATMPELRRVVRAQLAALGKDRARFVEAADELWAPGIYELRAAAVIVLTRGAKLLEEADVPQVERMLRESKTWALVDPLSTDVMGALVVRLGLADTLDRWSEDDDFWIRRASMLSLLKPLRAGGGDWDRFARYADAMLEEKEFFIRKAIGWILRDVGRKRPALAEAFIAPRTHRASGVTMREVVKVLPAARREELMAAYRQGSPA